MGLTARSMSSSFSLRDAGWAIFKRGCVECPATSPSCPACKSTEICSFVSQTCQNCAYMTCVNNPTPSSSPPAPSSTPDHGHGGGGSSVSGVAGGVVGGLAAIALVLFLLWLLFWRPRKKRALALAEQRRSQWSEKSSNAYQSRPQTHIYNQNNLQPPQQQNDRMSNVSRPLSQMTTTSNHIPIGFIDGVRGVPGSAQDGPVPPVPSIQSAHDIYFPASDIYKRDTQDTAYFTTGAGRQSITPSLDRGSIASGVFQEDGRDNPMPTAPAMAVAMQKPQVVSVRNAGGPTEISTARPIVLPGSSGSGESASSAVSATAATYVRPTITTINRSNSKRLARSDSTTSKTGPDSSLAATSNHLQPSPEEINGGSPVIMSATAAQPWGIDLNREIQNSTPPSKSSNKGTHDPFGDENASE